MTTRQFGHFDADALAAAQEEPTLVVGGRLYVGRLLSIEEWLRYADELDRLRIDPATTPRAYIAFYHRYLRAVFPRAWWARWAYWRTDPVRALFRLPWKTVVECIDRFFVLQAQASTPNGTPSASRSTTGTDSPPSTPSAPDPAAMV